MKNKMYCCYASLSIISIDIRHWLFCSVVNGHSMKSIVYDMTPLYLSCRLIGWKCWGLDVHLSWCAGEENLDSNRNCRTRPFSGCAFCSQSSLISIWGHTFPDTTGFQLWYCLWLHMNHINQAFSSQIIYQILREWRCPSIGGCNVLLVFLLFSCFDWCSCVT